MYCGLVWLMLTYTIYEELQPCDAVFSFFCWPFDAQISMLNVNSPILKFAINSSKCFLFDVMNKYPCFLANLFSLYNKFCYIATTIIMFTVAVKILEFLLSVCPLHLMFISQWLISSIDNLRKHLFMQQLTVNNQRISSSVLELQSMCTHTTIKLEINH